MSRTILALTALLCSLSPALASLSPRPAPLPIEDKVGALGTAPLPLDKPLPEAVVQAAYPRQHNAEYRITSRTEITLDGRPCRYADVPKGATILKMEVDSDNGAIVTIQFRSKK